MTNTKTEALTEIQRLIRVYDLSENDFHGFFKIEEQLPSQSNKVKTALAYLGGVLIFAGIGTYLSMIWADLDSVTRVVVTLGPGVIAFILGLAASHDQRFEKAPMPLFLIAACLQPTGLFVFLEEFFKGGEWHIGSMAIFFLMASQYFFVLIKYGRPYLGLLVIAFGFSFYGVLLDYLSVANDWSATILGLSGLLLTYGLGESPQCKGFKFMPFLYFVFGLCLAGGAYAIFWKTSFDFLVLGVGAFMVMASIQANSRTFLTVSVLSLLFYLASFSSKYFADVVGWPILLIVMGLVTIGLSGLAFKLGKSMKST